MKFSVFGENTIMDSNYKEIGRNIRQYRKKQGMKQKDLAERISVSEQHVSHIETGSTKLSLSTLVAIANALDIDCNTLLGKTLTGARRPLMNKQIQCLVSEMDDKKLPLCIEFCNILTDFEL